MVRDTRTGECHKQNTARKKHSSRCCYYYTAQNYSIFFREFREKGFEKSLVDARELAEELEMSSDEMIFANSSARRKRVRKQFDYEA